MKLIDKDRIVAEIERRIRELEPFRTEDNLRAHGAIAGYYQVLSFINTLEVKEVDFDAEWKRYFEYRGKIATVNIKHLAKHFFELGLKASCSVDLTPDLDTLFEEKGIDPYSKEAKIIKEAYYVALDKLAQKGE